jgi:hypothetical protein
MDVCCCAAQVLNKELNSTNKQLVSATSEAARRGDALNVVNDQLAVAMYRPESLCLTHSARAL